MSTFALIALAVTIVLIVAAIVVSRMKTHSDSFGLVVALAITAIVTLIASCITGWLAIAPEYRLHKATIEKRILVEQAKAEADAAVEEARAEVERAKGTAEANVIVADSITEPYLRYLYINSLRNTKNQVIYLPTEAGLPILEAQRGSK